MSIIFLTLKINTVLFGLQRSGYVIGARVRFPKWKFQLPLDKTKRSPENTAEANQFPPARRTAHCGKISGMLVRAS